MTQFLVFCQRYRPDILFLTVLITLSGVLFSLMRNPFLTVVNIDSAIFCLLAKAIAQGQGYALLSEPNPQPYFTFPPLLSLQLAGLMKLVGSTDIQALQGLFKGYIQSLFLLSLPLFYLWLCPLLGRRHAMALTTLVALNPIVFKYSSDVLSDTPYWFFSMGAICCAAFWNQFQANQDKRSPWFLVATLLFLLLACLTRQIGMALALAFLLFTAVQRQWKACLFFAVTVGLVVGGWQSYEHFYRLNHPVEADALNQAGVAEVLKDSPVKLEFIKHFLVANPVSEDAAHPQAGASLLQAAQTRLERYSEITLDQLLPPVILKLAGAKQNLFHAFPFLLMLWGLFFIGFKQTHPRVPLVGFYMLLYAGILLVYPYISPRFLLPLFPFVLVSLYSGLLQVKEWLQAQQKPVLQWAAVGLLPVFLLLALVGGALPQTLRWVNAGYELKQANAGPSQRPANAGFYRSVVWLKANTAPNSLIMSRKPPITYFYADRKSIAFPFTHDQGRLLGYLQDKAQRYQGQFPVLYVVEDQAFQETVRYLSPLIQHSPDHFSLVHTDSASGTKVWRFIP